MPDSKSQLRKRHSSNSGNVSIPKTDSPRGTSSKNNSASKKKNGGGTVGASPKESSMNKILTRLVFGLAMIGSFIGIVWAGHVYVWLLVVVLQTLIFKELVSVRYRAASEKDIPLFRSVQWCWFGVAMVYNYGDSLVTFLQSDEAPKVPDSVIDYLRYHTWFSFTLYALLFVMSVLSLKKGYYKYQMGQLTWTFVTLGMIVFQMKSVLLNILNGLFWLMFPASLVICNDCFAYFCGRLFGKKFIKSQFLKLSPNKTWEGFIGAYFFTVIFGFFFSYLLAQYTWMTCRASELHWLPQPLTCDVPYVFKAKVYSIPEFLVQYIHITTVTLLPIQLHSLVFSTFVSLISPFGGFFASAIKRAYKLKDFNNVIPGHGGVMDRMDCQFITSLFTTVYYNTFIMPSYVSVTGIMNHVMQLSAEDQQEVFNRLSKLLQQEA